MMLDLNGLQDVGRVLLRQVALSRIVSDNGILRHRSHDLPPDEIETLQTFHRHGCIALTPGAHETDLPTAQLTVTGMQLLGYCYRRPAMGAPITTPPAPLGVVTETVISGRSS